MKIGIENKIICVGRNYLEHALELNNSVDNQTPILFCKPLCCITPMQAIVGLPHHLGTIHHELEIYFTLNQDLSLGFWPNKINDNEKLPILNMGLALDLTLRDVQTSLKSEGHPWERSKAFDNSCPLSKPIEYHSSIDLTALEIKLYKNGVLVQNGLSKNMIFSINEIIYHINQSFSLKKHDIILTGTPAGVGLLRSNDVLVSELWHNQQQLLSVTTEIQ